MMPILCAARTPEIRERMPISQTLMGLPGTKLSDIRTVCSHAQGIAQSAQWRSENLPDAVTEEKDSTAAAASYVADSGDKTIAAIGAPLSSVSEK